ncbi:MAG: PQQ-binding-like beta-propeller repeat protein [Tepidisphaeraceae bacterium]|jgi:outer membrane protein assembly factor BamB
MMWLLFAAVALSLLPTLARAADWPQWCGHADRNSVSAETGLPEQFDTASGKPRGTPLQNVKWVARLGAGTFGSPVVANGKVFIGGAAKSENTAMFWCFQETDGKLLWRMRSPFWPSLVNRTWGVCSTPAVDGDRVYVLSHHGEVLCLDVNGLAGRSPSAADLELLMTDRTCANPFAIAPDGRRILELTAGTPVAPEPTDAHILWRYDMLREVNCWPYNAQSTSPLVRGDRLYVATGSTISEYANDGCKTAIDEWKARSGKTSYESPSLIVLDKQSGKLLAVDKEGIFDQTFHGAHASPVLGTVNGKELLFYGAGNGSCYAFDPDFAPGEAGKPGALKRVWKFDCLAATYAADYTGPKLKRAEVIATPVFHKNHIYVSIGNDLKNSGDKAGPGRLLCLDATGSGDITATAKVWSFDDIRSTGTTVAVADGLVYAADASGKIFCLDAGTGRLYWQHDASLVWSSVMLADGKVYVAARFGLLVFAQGKEKKLLGQSKVHESMVSSPAAANGVVYVATDKYLYALQQGKTFALQETPAPASTTPEVDVLTRALEKQPKPAWVRVLWIAVPAACVGAIVLLALVLRKVKRSKSRQED